MKIMWQNQPLLKKPPFLLVVAVVGFIAFNVYLNLKITDSRESLSEVSRAATQTRPPVPDEFAKKIELGEKNCPFAKAGNPNAPLTFKLFESETCPYCIAQNKVLDELLPKYGDLFYGEWYEVTTCIQQSEQYQISGVPTFVFTAQGVEKPPAYGFLDKKQLTGYICSVSQQC